MANLFDKLFGRPDDYDDFDDFDDLVAYDQPQMEQRPAQEMRGSGAGFLDGFAPNRSRRPMPQEHRSRNQNPRVLDMRSGESIDFDQEVIIMVPYNFEVTKQVCDFVKQGKTVICNIEKIDNDTAQRVLDFIMGATYALAGSLESISEKIFVVTPSTTRLSTRLEERQERTARSPYSNMRASQSALASERRFDSAPLSGFNYRQSGSYQGSRAANQ